MSHEDRDHSGSIMQIWDRCPNAKLITNFLGLGKLGEEFSFPLDRIYFLNDGDSLDIGDRTVTAIRPPLYDSGATRGLWDPSTELYFSADCFGIVSDEHPQFADEMQESTYQDAFYWMNRANHIWFEHIRQDAMDEAAEIIRKLGAKTIVSGHGPTIRDNPDKVLDWIKRIGDMPPIEFPDQGQFERMLADR
jgi:flavorubredoxin